VPIDYSSLIAVATTQIYTAPTSTRAGAEAQPQGPLFVEKATAEQNEACIKKAS
jgi:hypothetical protein